VRTTFETGIGLWATIRASDGAKGGPNQKFTSGVGQPLPAMAAQAVWPTPTAQQYGTNQGGAAGRTGPVRGSIATIANGCRSNLNDAAAMQNSNGSSEPTEKRGALNPEFVCWLMGYPSEWLSCAPSEMPSTSARLLRSSRRRAKVSLDKK
jgi:hypothetical protein